MEITPAFKLIAFICMLILSAFFFIFVLLLSEGDMQFFIIISCLTGFCLGADLIIPPSIQADVVDYDRLIFRKDRVNKASITETFITMMFV